jgi:hypothetical protein
MSMITIMGTGIDGAFSAVGFPGVEANSVRGILATSPYAVLSTQYEQVSQLLQRVF